MAIRSASIVIAATLILACGDTGTLVGPTGLAEADAGTDGQDVGTEDVAPDSRRDETPPGDTHPSDSGDPSVDSGPDVDGSDLTDAGDASDLGNDSDGRDLAEDGVDAGDAGTPEPFVVPERILFIGNSFTFQGPVPTVVDVLANDAGWPDPHVEYSAFGGESLAGHRGRSTTTLALVDEGDWDVVVLQEFSTRPTDNIGDPDQFKTDATWFHDRIKASSPDARVILYETWARHPDHAVYPGSFFAPSEMQSQLRFHYNDAAYRWIPDEATAAVDPGVTVARVGDTWEAHLAEVSPLRLHGDDDYHAGTAGRYLNGLVIYATIYERSVAGLTSWSLQDSEAMRLQSTADRVTGFTITGGPSGGEQVLGLSEDEGVLIDFGSTVTTDGRWHNLQETDDRAFNLATSEGGRSTVDVTVTRDFGGINLAGIESNERGYPAAVSADSLYCGSFSDHTDGLTKPAQITVSDLDPVGFYEVILFASRSGDDGGIGRLTRYTVGDDWLDVDASDNRAEAAIFEWVVPREDGTIVIDVAVSPDGTGRFCYLGALEIWRL